MAELQTRKKWQRGGWYATRQTGGRYSAFGVVDDDTHYSVEKIEIEYGFHCDRDELNRIARSMGLGTPRWVENEEDL